MAKETGVSTDAKRKIVRIYSRKPQYRTQPYFACPEYDAVNGMYKTGQTKVCIFRLKEKNPEIKSQEKFEKLPLIIRPDEHYPIVHNAYLSVKVATVEPVLRDDVLHSFFKELSNVATNKNEFNPTKHTHFMESAEDDAIEEVNRFQLVLKAIDHVREDVSLERLNDIGLLLKYDLKRLSSKVVESKIYQECQENPQKVIECFEDGAMDKLFIFKLTHHGILVFKEGRYWFGEKIIGDLDSAIEYTQSQDETKAAIAATWQDELAKIG